MTETDLAPSVLHELPEDMADALRENATTLDLWNEIITPIARNEWICWVTSAKKPETRAKRIGRMQENLLEGKRRPCCWPGCDHRVRDGGRS